MSLENGGSGKRRRGAHWRDGKRRVCALCRNPVWEELDERVEKTFDYHFNLTPTTLKKIHQVKTALHTTYEGVFRTVLRDYEIYTTILENQRIEGITGLRRTDLEVNTEEVSNQ